MGSVEEIVQILADAKTDTQMLMGLTCVPKLINIKSREKAEGDWEKKLFTEVARIVPVEFFERLVTSMCSPPGCPPFMYHSVGFSVLSALVVHMDKKDQLSSHYLHVVCGGLDRLLWYQEMGRLEPEDFDAFLLTLRDALTCCRYLLLETPADLLLMEIPTVIAIGRSLTRLSKLTDEAMDLLQLVVDLSVKHSLTITDSPTFNGFIHGIVTNIKADRSEKMTDSLRHLSLIITPQLARFYESRQSAIWTEDLVRLTSAVIQSRLKHQVKQIAIRLADSLLELFGLQCFQSNPQFFQLLVSVTTVELKLLLDEVAEKEATAEQKGLLFTCCSLLEEAVKLVTDDDINNCPVKLSDAQLDQVNQRLLDAVKMVGEFIVVWEKHLSLAERNVLNFEIIPPLFRFLCSYMTDDCTLLLEELKVGLPAILKVTQWLTERQAEFDAVGLLLPGLSHMTSDEHLVKLLVDHHTLGLCVEYFRREIVVWLKDSPSGGAEDRETINGKLEGVLIVILNLLLATTDCSTPGWTESLMDLSSLVGKVFLKVGAAGGRTLSSPVTSHLIAVELQLDISLRSGDTVANPMRFTTGLEKVRPLVVALLRAHSSSGSEVESGGEATDVDELWQFNMESLIELIKLSDEWKAAVRKSGWEEEMFVRLKKATDEKHFDEMCKKFVSLLSAIDAHHE